MSVRYIIAGVQAIIIMLISLAWMYAMWPAMSVGVSAYVVVAATAYFYRGLNPDAQREQEIEDESENQPSTISPEEKKP